MGSARLRQEEGRFAEEPEGRCPSVREGKLSFARVTVIM